MFGFVVLTNYEGQQRGFLCRLMDTLSKCLGVIDSTDISLKAIIVDDGSKDGSMELLKQFEDTRPDQVDIRRTDNLDVTGAMNHGISYALKEYAQSEFVITLDNDTALSSRFLLAMIRKAEKTPPRVGMLASNQYLLDSFPEKTVHRSTGHYVDAAGATMDRDFFDKRETRMKRILCPCLSGALYKVDMLKSIGLVSKEYVHYNNCSELGFRAQIDGWRVEFIKSAVMWHHCRQQSEISPLQKEHRELSRIWNILRFFPHEEVGKALAAYKDERNKTSPTLEEKLQYIKKAQEKASELFPSAKEGRKKEIYNRFIVQSTH